MRADGKNIMEVTCAPLGGGGERLQSGGAWLLPSIMLPPDSNAYAVPVAGSMPRTVTTHAWPMKDGSGR